jgi:hypothetical protein
MATQKQRRRRAKEKRHDYDLVYVDEDGVEKPVAREESPRQPTGRGSKGSKTSSSTKAKSGSAGGRQRKEAQPPSWPKVFKRGAIFAPVFFGTVILLSGKGWTVQSARSAIIQTVLLIVVFIPFSYFMDRVVWRQQQKRLGRGT